MAASSFFRVAIAYWRAGEVEESLISQSLLCGRQLGWLGLGIIYTGPECKMCRLLDAIPSKSLTLLEPQFPHQQNGNNATDLSLRITLSQALELSGKAMILFYFFIY
jgi:hypothetical protein